MVSYAWDSADFSFFFCCGLIGGDRMFCRSLVVFSRQRWGSVYGLPVLLLATIQVCVDFGRWELRRGGGLFSLWFVLGWSRSVSIRAVADSDVKVTHMEVSAMGWSLMVDMAFDGFFLQLGLLWC